MKKTFWLFHSGTARAVLSSIEIHEWGRRGRGLPPGFELAERKSMEGPRAWPWFPRGCE